MKKHYRLALLLLALLMLTACTQDPVETTTPTETTLATLPPETIAPTETTQSVDPELQYFRENLPIMDGSTSLIPLEAGIRAAIFDLSLEDATAQVSHTSTWGSFNNLLTGCVDLIFSVDLSEVQHAMAADAGITLETVPIAKEGFVFVVNAANPVDTLTQEQIKAIYSGQITNWSEVGGEDLPIIAYQRNTDSGSQNYMTAFMGDTPLIDAPTEMRPASMSGLMDVIAVNDNSSAAIGYSVYAYAADMYGNGNEIKFIQVDGVAPSKATFADGSYPLLGYNYAVFSAAQPADSPVRRLVSWMLSEAGQTAIAQVGYVTVTDIGFDYQEATLTKYQATGIGAPAGETPSSEYTAIGTGYTAGGSPFPAPYLVPSVETLPNGTRTYRVTQLADAALQDEINAFIDEQMVWAAEERPVLEALIDSWNAKGDAIYSYGCYWSNQQPDDMDAACIITARNGYLSVAITMRYDFNVQGGYTKHYKTRAATWDLLTGQRLTTEDLFCEGVGVDEVLNEAIRHFSLTMKDEFSGYPDLKADFAGLTTEGWSITIDGVYMDYENPYFSHGEFIEFDSLPDGVMVTETLRDFSECFAPDCDAYAIRQFRYITRDTVYSYSSNGLVACGLLDEGCHPNAARINADIMAYVNSYYAEDAIRGYIDSQGHNGAEATLYQTDYHTLNWGGKYIVCRSGYMYMDVSTTDGEFTELSYPADPVRIYDLATGKRIEFQDMLRDGWEEAGTWADGEAPADDAELIVFSIYELSEGIFRIVYTDHYTSYYFDVPNSYLIY